MKNENNIKGIIEYGLEKIEDNEKCSVKIRDLVYLYKTFQELNAFLHNPEHYSKIEDVKKYFGDVEIGVYHHIHKIYYEMFDEILPREILSKLSEGEFESPVPPFYKSRI